MFPNPSNTYVNITPGTDLIKYINVYNILGKTVLKIPNTNSQGIIQTPTYSFSNGIYVIEIRTTNAVYREKLIVHN